MHKPLASDYIMTVRANLLVRPVTASLLVIEVTSGEVNGPNIKGRLIAPTADWLRLLPSGVGELDVRALIETDDGALIYSSYKGVLKQAQEVQEHLNKGEIVKGDDFYLVGTPRYETAAPAYTWMNEIQAVGKMVEFHGTHFTFDVFAVR